jgi:hypothetical protein
MNDTNHNNDAEHFARANEQEHQVTDTEPTLDGIEVEPSKAAVFDEFVKSQLKSGLIAFDRMEMPRFDAEYASNAEHAAAYAPYHAAVNSFLWHSTLAHVLIRVKENAPRIAEAIVSEVKDYLDAGDAYPEWIWDWAVAAGLDPETIKTEAREKYAAWLAAPPRAVPAAPVAVTP